MVGLLFLSSSFSPFLIQFCNFILDAIILFANVCL